MLLTTLTFVVGGNMEKLCQPLIDLSLFSEVSRTREVSCEIRCMDTNQF